MAEMRRLKSKATGQVREFSPEEALRRLETQRGRWEPVDGAAAPKQQAALDVPASPQRAAMEHLASTAGAGKAALAGAASGATLGLSDFALEGLGVDTKALRKENPVATVAGELAGSILPFSGAARLAGSAGKAVGPALARLVGSRPLPEFLKAAAKTGAATALVGEGQRAIDYGATQLVMEDKERAAEIAANSTLAARLEDFGMGTVASLALSTATGIGGKAAQSLAAKLPAHTLDRLKVRGKIRTEAEEYKRIASMADEARQMSLVGAKPADTLEKLRVAYQEAGAAITAHAKQMSDKVPTLEGFQLHKAATDRARERLLLPKNFEPKTPALREAVIKLQNSPALTVGDLQELKNKVPALRQVVAKSEKPYLNMLNSELDEYLSVNVPGLAPLKDRYKNLGDLYKTARREAGKPGRIGFDLVRNAYDLIPAAETKSAIYTIADKINSITQRSRQAPSWNIPKAGQAVLGVAVSARNADSYDATVQAIRGMNQSPQKALEAFGEANQQLYEEAPEVYDIGALNFGRTIKYLQDQIPKPPPGHNPATLLDSGWRPNPGQQQEFMEKVNACIDPQSVLDRPTVAGVLALKATNPRVFSTVQDALLDKISNTAAFSFRERLYMSRILGTAVSSLNAPQFANNMQQVFGSEPKPKGQKGSARNAGAQRQKEMNVRNAADMNRTLIDSIATRRKVN